MNTHNDHKRVLITGCSSGFGRLIALKLAAAGHRVFATMRAIDGANSAAATELKAHEGITVLELDVTDDASVDSAVRAAVTAAGGLDVVVNNAGVAGLGLLEGYSPERLRALFEVNVFGVQRVCRAALPTLRKQTQGLLVFVSSTMGRVVIPCAGAYTASKFALEALAETYSYELAALGIDVTIIEPGTHPTSIGENMQAWQADDPERVADYGPASAIPERVQGSIVQVLSSPTPPNSDAVAEAVAGVVNTPTGRRPRRIVVDELTGAGVVAINEAATSVQDMALGGLDLAGICTPTQDP